MKPEDRTIDVNIKKNPNMGVVNNMRENYGFKFDQLLHNSSQDTVYADTISDITKSIVQGYNGTVLVYGQTGAGKTYTMSGGQGDYKARGMIPRAIQEIFTEVRFRWLPPRLRAASRTRNARIPPFLFNPDPVPPR